MIQEKKRALLLYLTAFLYILSLPIAGMEQDQDIFTEFPYQPAYEDRGRTDAVSFIDPNRALNERKTTRVESADSDMDSDIDFENDPVQDAEDILVSADDALEEELYATPQSPSDLSGRIIKDIIVSGNTRISTESVMTFVNYKKGERYNPTKRKELILNLYHGLKRLRTITVSGEPTGNDFLTIYIHVEEKTPLKEIIFTGNKHLNSKEIIKQLHTNDIVALDDHELKPLAQKIKKLYTEKGYQSVGIETQYTLDENNIATATFIINEGKQSLIKQIIFKGNTHATNKELHGAIYTKEDWILGFLDKSGSYHPERIMYGDKQQLEQYYQNRGFLHAKVTDIKTDIDPDTKNITLIFEIEEGACYTIQEVTAQAQDDITSEQIVSQLPLRPGMIYSRELIAASIKKLELLWGNAGYIFTHVEPSIIPNEDTKTVSISFSFERGNQVNLNRINIRGNKKTRDKVIRRKIMLQEGDLLRQGLLEQSKYNIQSLGYFDQRDGVFAKIKRINKETADVDFIVKETKTGHFGAQIGFGGAGVDLNSPSSGFTVKGEMADTNLFGSGIDLNLSATWAKEEQTLVFHIGQPWLFEKPILGALDIYHKRPSYSDLRNIDGAVNEKLTGMALTAGVIIQSHYDWLKDTQILTTVGVDSIKYQKQPLARFDVDNFQPILNRAFEPGNFVWISNIIDQDTRNHPMHPSSGHRWKAASKVAIPSFGDNIGYYKFTLDTNWYTSLIEEYNLVLRVHAFFGVATPFNNRVIPFGELFHIGGDNSVRGFLYGQIGPKFLGDTIGAKKAFFVNTELIFPITSDYSMKCVIFYDGGAGWDNPYLCNTNRNAISGNSFDYRHSVGIGIRLLRPMPIKVDWGFKIDPRSDRRDRRNGESASELHFGMSYDW